MAVKPLSLVHLRLPKLYYTHFVSCREKGEENKQIDVTEELSHLSVAAAAKQDGPFFFQRATRSALMTCPCAQQMLTRPIIASSLLAL